MKIGNTPPKPPAPAATAAGPAAAPGVAAKAHAAPAAAPTPATPAVPEASTNIKLSSAASSLLAASASTPEFDAEKVSRISEAIGNGSFKVNPEVVADKLISNAQELLARARH